MLSIAVLIVGCFNCRLRRLVNLRRCSYVANVVVDVVVGVGFDAAGTLGPRGCIDHVSKGF